MKQQNYERDRNLKEIITYSPELQHLFDMWHHATDLNNVNAQFNLACCFVKIKQKKYAKKVFSLFKKLANQDYTKIQTDAQFMLAECYENGYGIQKSYPRAIRWYETAANNVVNDLINNPDPMGDTANKAFEKAIENQNIDETLDEILFGKITPELINCITESAYSGDVEAQIYLMNLYNLGGGYIEEDIKKCAYWTEKAAKNGNTKAMENLGNMYYYGKGVKQDYKSALYWLEKSSSQGTEYSCYLLGKYYKSQKQYKKSAKWYRTYAERKIKWRNKRLDWEKR